MYKSRNAAEYAEAAYEAAASNLLGVALASSWQAQRMGWNDKLPKISQDDLSEDVKILVAQLDESAEFARGCKEKIEKLKIQSDARLSQLTLNQQILKSKEDEVSNLRESLKEANMEIKNHEHRLQSEKEFRPIEFIINGVFWLPLGACATRGDWGLALIWLAFWGGALFFGSREKRN